ncbi:MAG: aryl-sulfate sulfotransferase [Bacteroidales bacterium]|nr:aryl-sulfate sulfotransferase [Bacteroidales bacterium]
MKNLFLLLSIIPLFLLSCEKLANREACNCIPDVPAGFFPENLKTDDYRNNVLRKKITFSTSDPVSSSIIYWKNEGEQLITTQTAQSTDHSFILLNLEENSSYSYILVSESLSGEISRSEIHTFQTGSIPVEHDKYAFNSYPQIHDNSFNEFIIVHQRENEKKLLLILNRDGEIVWYHKFHKNPDVFRWTSRGTILCMLSKDGSLLTESDEVLEINLYGDTLSYFRKAETSFTKGLHHDLIRSKKGTIYALHYDYRIVDFSPLGYHETDTIFCDGITELDSAGNVCWEWSAFDVADPLGDPVSYVRRNDWLHANSLCEDDRGNLIVSFRHNNQIWKIDRESGEVIWKFGEKGDFDIEERYLPSGQHHVYLSDIGDLIIFDNNNEASQSRILFFRLNQQSFHAELIKEVILPRQYYSYIMGSAEQTSDHNLLVLSTTAQAISLVDYAGNIIWEIETEGFPYRAVLMENFNNNYGYCTAE